MLVRLVKEIADSNWTLQRQRGIQRAPRERNRAGSATLLAIATMSVTDTGKLTFHRAGVQPVLRVGGQSKTCRCSQKVIGDIFKADHIFALFLRAERPGDVHCATFALRRSSILAVEIQAVNFPFSER